MNVMTDLQRTDVNNAALIEVLAETGDFTWKVSSTGLTMDEYISQYRQYIESHRKSGEKVNDFQLQILSDACQQNDSFGNIQIIDIDAYNGAVTTYDATTDTYTVSFCGTRGNYGEIGYNGVGLSHDFSHAQDNAVQYFDMISNKFKPGSRIVVSGHSNGGNKSQYVTMNAKYRERIDLCVSLDGQNHSKEAVEKMKNQEDYDIQRNKILQVCGENDFVSQLGEVIVPEYNVFFLERTYIYDEEHEFRDELLKDHYVQYLFKYTDGYFTAQLNSEVEQGPLGQVVRELYDTLYQNLSDEDFDKTCRVLMSLWENGLDQESLDVIAKILPYCQCVLNTTTGKRFLKQYLHKGDIFENNFLDNLVKFIAPSKRVQYDVFAMLYILYPLARNVVDKKQVDKRYYYADVHPVCTFDTEEILQLAYQYRSLTDAINDLLADYELSFNAHLNYVKELSQTENGKFNTSQNIVCETQTDKPKLYSAQQMQTLASIDDRYKNARKQIIEASSSLQSISKTLKEIATFLGEAESTAQKYGMAMEGS